MGMMKHQLKYYETSSPFIILPLAYISNKMLSSSIFLDRLNYAEIKPLFKGGCKNDPSIGPFPF
jgi:hypothetical protein